MADRSDLKRYRRNLGDEQNAATLYEAMAQATKDPLIADLYRRLAETERKHAGAWAEKLREAGGQAPGFTPSWRTRALGWVARRFGADVLLLSLAGVERSAASSYADQPEAAGMGATERSHAVMFSQLARTSPKGMDGSTVARLEGRHRTASGNALRAAVLGASDGLLSNFNLVMGVAGAGLVARNILLTGAAGMIAGAISMGLGEWISVQSSRELYEKQIGGEREEIENAPEEEIEELVLIYRARGIDEATARTMATGILSDPDTALDALARDELGIDPSELGGSAFHAALVSFLLFATGAALPVLPFVFLSGVWAIAVSAALSAAGLFLLGAAITLFTGKPVLLSGLRQVGFGVAAAAAVFLIGHLIGARLGG